jgi:hypothetical protein
VGPDSSRNPLYENPGELREKLWQILTRFWDRLDLDEKKE